MTLGDPLYHVLGIVFQNIGKAEHVVKSKKKI
jgi:hypothetical protein